MPVINFPQLTDAVYEQFPRAVPAADLAQININADGSVTVKTGTDRDDLEQPQGQV
jgi:hypothetical protein